MVKAITLPRMPGISEIEEIFVNSMQHVHPHGIGQFDGIPVMSHVTSTIDRMHQIRLRETGTIKLFL